MEILWISGYTAHWHYCAGLGGSHVIYYDSLWRTLDFSEAGIQVKTCLASDPSSSCLLVISLCISPFLGSSRQKGDPEQLLYRLCGSLATRVGGALGAEMPVEDVSCTVLGNYQLPWFLLN